METEIKVTHRRLFALEPEINFFNRCLGVPEKWPWPRLRLVSAAVLGRARRPGSGPWVIGAAARSARGALGLRCLRALRGLCRRGCLFPGVSVRGCPLLSPGSGGSAGVAAGAAGSVPARRGLCRRGGASAGAAATSAPSPAAGGAAGPAVAGSGRLWRRLLKSNARNAIPGVPVFFRDRR